MATNTLFKHLLTLSRSGKRVNFLQALNHYSLLTVSPEAMGPRNVSLLIHSFGNLRLADKEHWRILENYFHSQKEEMNAHDVAVTVWGFAKSSNAIDSSTWKSLEHATRQYLMQFTPKELASICYSFAAIDCKSKLLWDSLRNAVLGQLFYMAPENLPPTVWAFSKIGFKDEKVWSMLERKIFMEIKKLTPTCQSIIIYGFAITENGSVELWSLFEKVFYQNIGDYKDKDIKNIIWSFRKMKRNAGNKLCQDMVNTLKSDFAKYSMGTIVGLGHAIRETTGLTPEFKELLSNSLNDEEKMENLSYGHAASFAKLLFHARIKDDALWDRLALKFKQLIRTTRTFDLKAHMFFTMHNPAYWSFFCEESVILYFEKVFRMDPKVREKSIGTEEYLDVGCLAHHCYSNKLASKMFWTQCSKYLQLKKINVRKTDPGSVAKIMYAFTGRYTDNEVLMGHWFEYADEICNDLKLVETYMKDPKAFRILMRSFIKVDKFSELLKQIEKLYEACDYREEDLTSLISKTLNWKKEGETREKFPVQKISQVLESYDMEAKKEIMKGIIENWLNIFCEAEYKLRPIYLDLYEKLAKNEDTADSTLKEGEEKVNEEEDGSEEIKQDFEVEAEKLGDIMMGPNDLVFEGPSNNPSKNRNRNMPKLMI